jgi:ABC-2 type transport system ATP-binding protein
MLLGLAEPDSGTVSVFGMSPRDAVAAGSIGGMLQVGSLIRELRVRELVAMVASLYPRSLPVDHALELAGVADLADRRTIGLSGGETQKVRFAVAMVANPDLLVLDEPTAAMDVAARRWFWDAMRAFASGGRTVLFATHYLEEADANADRIMLMSGGRIVADGSPSEIKARVGVRVISATLPGVPESELASMPGVATATRQGTTVVLSSVDADSVLRRFLVAYPAACDIEVRSGGLEAAFLELTASDGPTIGQSR